MNVKDLLALAYLTPDAYAEVPEAGASAALAGDIVIVTVQPAVVDEVITVNVHTHGGDRGLAAECFARFKGAFDQATENDFAHQLDHTAVTADTFYV